MRRWCATPSSGSATVIGLCRSAERDKVCSRGRVVAWVERAMKLGLIHVAPGHEAWTQRRLILDPRLGEAITMRIRSDVAALSGLAPELRAVSEVAWPADSLKIYLSTLLELAFRKPEIVSGTPMPITQLMHIEAGIEFLAYLVVQKTPREATGHRRRTCRHERLRPPARRFSRAPVPTSRNCDGGRVSWRPRATIA